MDTYIGQIILFSGTYVISNFMECNGQLLPIRQYNALYAVLGNTYGGDGVNTFALPDLRGRVPAHAGQGSGLPNVTMGQTLGAASATLTSAQLPAVAATVNVLATSDTGDTASPANALPAVHLNAADPSDPGLTIYRSAATVTPGNTVTMQAARVTIPGGGQPVPTVSPALGLKYLICVSGVFPPRD
ncbi:phage tail protein [Deinococcus xianganensis]|uniref:Phage tail protein n=1 Tax=Deinococcus xianganensis TaxID=1507289 RepID=A0A6I4YVJ3_9DEIO|nr:tail fiber protein [Deinococcus xianganensis]MXV21133.1 phage tail protein [Deinococcus xianganensis]